MLLGTLIAGAIPPQAAAVCTGSYVSRGSLTGRAALERIAVGFAQVTTDSCGTTAARVVSRPRGTKVKATFTSCAGLPGRARLVALIDEIGCSEMLGLFRARRAGIETAFTASLGGSLDVQLSVPPPAAPAAGSGSASHRRGVAASAAAEFVPGELIVRFRDAGSQARGGGFTAAGAETAKVAGDPASTSGALYRIERPVRLGPAAAPDARAETLAAVEAMRARPDVLWAQPNYVRQPLRLPNDELLRLQWHYPLISLPAAWDVTIGSPEVIVAVIDTGLLIGHPDIATERLVPGFDFISNPATAQDGDGIDGDPFDVGDGRDGKPSTFHGTHVTGTIGASTDNGVGVAGVDWSARIMPLRALGAGGGSDFDIANAILFAAGLANASGRVPAERADVINMSLGGPGFSPAMHEAVRAARAAGAIIVAAAGNDDVDAANDSPAGFPEVVSVSAVDLARRKAPYSNFGAVVDVAAPGGDLTVDRDGDDFDDGVLSTLGAETPDGGIRAIFAFEQGTSMAAPHVAGVVALMQAAFRASHGGARMTPDQFDAFLASGAITDSLGRDGFSGHGLINAHKAVLAAAAGERPAPPAPGDGDEPGGEDDEPAARGGDIGPVFVLVLDPDSGAVLVESETDFAGGYRVRFPNTLPAGSVLVAAGTDRDRDERIGDTGEAFAEELVEILGGDETAIGLSLRELTADAPIGAAPGR
jgi:subtilisin family serine protease